MRQDDHNFAQPENSARSESVPPYFLPFKIRRLWLAVALVALISFSFGLLLDVLLIHARGMSQLQAAAILDAVFALIVAALFYKLVIYDRERRTKVVERLETIDLMNHHIRNALQVISFNTHSQTNGAELAEIDRAMNRIQWALREILPRVEPEFTGFERSVRDKSGEELFKSSAPQKR